MQQQEIQSKREKEKAVVSLMIRLYCRGHHGKREDLCPDCTALEAYAHARSDRCPFMESKTFCSNCTVHCYRPEMREKIREVMRWSGPRMIFYHPVLALRHLMESKKEKRQLRREAETRAGEPEKKTPLRALWILLGCIFLGLGTLGVALPILPTVPFYLLTLFCFARGSRRLHDWFIGTRLYHKHLESYVKKEGLRIKTKWSIVAMVTLLMGVGIFLMSRKGLWVPCGILAGVWLFHVIYFFGVVKTLPETEDFDRGKDGEE